MSQPALASPDAPAAASPARERRERLQQILISPTFLSGAAIVAFWAVAAVLAPALVPYDPFADDMLNTLMPPSGEHYFGTDSLGRDVFSRVMTGSRDILTVAPIATLLGTLAGTILGLVMGYSRGWLDEALNRIVDALLALPTVIVALLALVALGTSKLTVIMVIAFTFAPIIARTVRAAVLTERELDYVAAAKLRLEGPLYIMFAEILPNISAPVLVETTVRLGYAIFTVATLSFIGFGIQPPSPDWGLSISANYGLIGGGYWWTVLFDGLAIASLVIGVNLIVDGLEGALDA